MAQLTLLQEECKWFKDLSRLREDRERSWRSYPHFKNVENWVNTVRCPAWVVQKLNTLQLVTGPSFTAGFASLKVWESPGLSRNASVVSSLLAALKECSLSRDLERGRKLHSQAVDNGLLSNPYVSSCMINMYSKCGSMAEACKIFNSLLHPDVVCWNCLIQGYTENNQSEVALELFEQMESFCSDRGCLPGSRTYVAALSACASLAARKDEKLEEWLAKAKEIYTRAVESSSCNTFVENTLLDMYCRCGRMAEARNVFDNMATRDVVSWTALLQGYVENGESLLALELFDASLNVVPNARTYVTAITACGTLASEKASEKARWLEKGREIHSSTFDNRSSNNIVVQTSLMDMYSKCGSMTEARKIFDNMASRDVVAWNAIVQGYVDNEEPEVALELFESMDCVRNARSYAAAVTACAKLVARKGGSVTRWLERGKSLHSQAVNNRCSDAVVGTALLNMYMACGSTAEARDAFDKMVKRDAVAWDTLVHGYVNNGENEQALEAIRAMEAAGSKQDTSSFVTAFTACGNLLRLGAGRSFHAETLRRGLEGSSQVTSSLLQFYGKCGRSMDAAEHIFNSAGATDDVYAWNSLMSGYSQQGDTAKVFEVWEKMTEQGTSPNEVTLTLVLAACGHAGLADKAKKVFDAMVTKHGICPDVRHYTCMVDLLGRANRLKEAVELAQSMKSKADTVTWTAVLDACSKWKNVELGKVAYAALLETPGGKQDASTYVLMGNLLANVGLWDERAKVLREFEVAGGNGKEETEMRKRGPGPSATERSASSYCLLSEMRSNMYSQGNFHASGAPGNVTPSSGGGYMQQGPGDHGNMSPPAGGRGGPPPPYNRPPGNGDGNMPPGVPPYNRPPPPGMYGPGGNMPRPGYVPLPPGGNMRPGVPRPGGWPPQGGYAPPASGQTNIPQGNYAPPRPGQWNMPQGGYGPPAPQGGYGPPGNLNAPQGGYGPPGNVNTPQGGYGPPGNANAPQGGYGPPGNVNAPQGGYGSPGNVNAPQGGYGHRGPGTGSLNGPQGDYGPPGNLYTPQGGYGPPGGSFNRPPGGGYRPPGSAPISGRTAAMPPPSAPGNTPQAPETGTVPGASTLVPKGDNTSTWPAAVGSTLPTSGKVIRHVAPARTATPPSSRTSTAPAGKITPGDGDGDEKEQTCSELMAIAYALVHSEPGSVIRIVKDCRVCDDCHEIVKKITIKENRKIICRDNTKFHIYENGKCSCGDYW